MRMEKHLHDVPSNIPRCTSCADGGAKAALMAESLLVGFNAHSHFTLFGPREPSMNKRG